MISREEAIVILENTALYRYAVVSGKWDDKATAIKLAIEALKQTADKDCSRCVMRNSCLVKHEFKYMDYCQDWSEADD